MCASPKTPFFNSDFISNVFLLFVFWCSNLLFPILIWTFKSLFYLDIYIVFLFGLFPPFYLDFYFPFSFYFPFLFGLRISSQFNFFNFGPFFLFSIFENLKFGYLKVPAHCEFCNDHKNDPDSLPKW